MIRHSLFLLCLLFAVRANDDPCAPHPNCQECVADTPHVCGWCSTPVVYKNGGQLGNRCVTNDGSHPFACYGVFSTEDCIRGYVCDSAQGICVMTDPGAGLPYDVCIKNCSGPTPPPNPSVSPSPPAQTWLCDETNYTCVKTDPGRGTSLEVCMQLCKPHPSPLSPSPHVSPAQVFLCNTTNWQCQPCEPGHGTSKEVCLQECKPHPSPSPINPTDKFICNFTSYQCIKSNSPNATSLQQCQELCVQLYTCDQTGTEPMCVIAPFPTPGVPLATCQQNCKPHNNTPSDLVGLWRGLQFNPGYHAGEWDVEFKTNTLTLKFENKFAMGLVSYIGPAPTITVIVHITSSNYFPVGSMLKMLFSADGAAPEVRYLELASSAPNGATPASIDTAFKSSTGFYWNLVSCQPATKCKFDMSRLRRAQPLEVQRVQVNDPCSALATCTECLARSFCGWCSVDVVYKDGTPGRHCAGWNNDSSRNQFTCSGVYRTDDCDDYLCVQPQGDCVKVPIGGGSSKADCLAHCKASPSGSPVPVSPSQGPAPTYLCNLTSHTCFLTTPGTGTSYEVCMRACVMPTPPSPVSPISPNPSPAPVYACNTTNYKCYPTEPGHGTSKEVCLRECKPGPGPVPIKGKFRGIRVDNTYLRGEYDLTINDDDTFEVTFNGSALATGSLSTTDTLGLLLAKVNSGPSAGKSFPLFFTKSTGHHLTQYLISVGKDEGDRPTGWDVPWILGDGNGSVFVFWQ